ncbi:sodium-dependent transporter [uncultured Clostridium sp.]|uniref:sodium-dependent transporter n=1 Tax=uncultured Clostridium sp. TaxID=59620 RepID=UPI002621D912|nr:sodium-dependent transporter [uncultured Clostridium sp.]
MEEKREKFSSGLTVFLATLSSAVGLGNIWMFPFVVGENGGAAFIIVYLGCILMIGIPTLICEFVVGRSTRKNVYGAVSEITEKKGFKIIGIIGLVASYMMLFFYTVVVGWVYCYVFKAITSGFKGITADGAIEMFNKVSMGPMGPIVWQIVALSVVGIILGLGVKSGIEKITKIMMPILVALLVICAIRSLTLPGAMEGVKFLLKPDFSKVSLSVVLTALGLAFFKLSVGTGTMYTYSSYFTEDNELIKTAGKVALADTCVSLIAGLAIFPAVFSFNLEPSQGPGLLFNTVPLIFSKMPGGRILGIVFFLLTAMAATMATISIVQVLIATFTEEFKMKRSKAIIINTIIVIMFGALAALSANPEGVLGNIKIFGDSFFDLFNNIVSNILLPVNGILVTIMVGYFVSKKKIIDQLNNNNTLKNTGIVNIILFIIKYITPVLIVIVFLKTFI